MPEPLRRALAELHVPERRQPVQLHGEHTDTQQRHQKRRHGDREAGPGEQTAVEAATGAEASENTEEQRKRNREEEGDEREAERHRQALGDFLGDGLPAVERRAQIALHHVAQPVAVLDDERPVELELVADLLDGAGWSVGPAGEGLRRVTRDEGGEAEHEERDDQENRHEGEQPPRDHPQHSIAFPLYRGTPQSAFVRVRLVSPFSSRRSLLLEAARLPSTANRHDERCSPIIPLLLCPC